MSEKLSGKSEMSSVEFVSDALRRRGAPTSIGPVKARIWHAARELGWTVSRTKDAWYADPRISLSADEVRDIEEATGLRYGRQELKEIDKIIARADALLEGADPDFHRPFVAAIRAFFGALDRTGTEG
ncbi:MAG: hypothetical protein AB7I42_25065 [Bradyrhizobium sp.]|uniref:hypothetical protein n=1 Tax=Bradyrhizobium sp. TaxID=376 RepID=UPI003D0FCCA1